MWSRTFALASLLFVPIAAPAQESKEASASFDVALVDVDGRPVEGAQIGIWASIGWEHSGETTEWHYSCHAASDAKGSVRVSEDFEGKTERCCLVARHEGRKISAVASVDLTKSTESIKLTLAPECVVIADVACSDLEGKWRPGQIVHVYHAGKIALSYNCTDFKIRLPLPPGDYEFQIFGDLACELRRPVQIIAAESQNLESFDLPATKLGLLQGKPAPEIPDVVGWKNGPAPSLASLRGKCVILDFFGYWCGPCVHQMPEVMALHDKYRDQGLVVIGVHTDLGVDEDEPIDTVEELDDRLAEPRADLWNGRDLPFPVALTKCVRTRYREDLPEFDKTARSNAAAQYGVLGYPTQILIDRRGNVVGQFHFNEAGIKQLEQALLDE